MLNVKYMYQNSRIRIGDFVNFSRFCLFLKTFFIDDKSSSSTVSSKTFSEQQHKSPTVVNQQNNTCKGDLLSLNSTFDRTKIFQCPNCSFIIDSIKLKLGWMSIEVYLFLILHWSTLVTIIFVFTLLYILYRVCSS